MSITTKKTSMAPDAAHEQPSLARTDIKVGSSVLKDIYSVEIAQETRIPRSVIRDIKATVAQCERDLATAKKYGLDDGQKLGAVKEMLSQAEKTGRLPGHIDPALLRRYKSGSTRSKLDDRNALLRLGQYPAHRPQVGYSERHDLIDVRHEMLAMMLNNRQLAGAQKGSKTLQEQQKESGFGGELTGEVNEALEERIKNLLAEEQAIKAAAASQQDRTEEEVHVDMLAVEVDNGFATELRNQQDFGFLQGNEGLDVLLDGVVDIIPYIAERRAAETGREASEIAAEVYQFQELVQKRKKKGTLVDEEDCETLLLVQYLPILYDAVNYMMSKDLPAEAISQMESLKGELSALIQGAADPASAIHELFKQIKDALQDREMVEWTG